MFKKQILQAIHKGYILSDEQRKMLLESPDWQELLTAFIRRGDVLYFEEEKKMFELPNAREIVCEYIKKHYFLLPANEMKIFDFEDCAPLVEAYLKDATLLGKTKPSQEFLLKAFEMEDAEKYIRRCLQQDVFFSPKVQLKMFEQKDAEQLVFEYIIRRSKYVSRWKYKSPLSDEAQMKLFELPHAAAILWLYSQTWELCDEAKARAQENGWI